MTATNPNPSPGGVDANVEVIANLSDVEYHSKTSVSSTLLKNMYVHDLETARWHATHPVDGDSPALRFGRAFHSHILESGPRVEVRKDRRTKEGKAQATLDEDGKIVTLTDTDMARLEAMADALNQNQIARDVMSTMPRREESVFWTDPATGLECRARFDLAGDFAIGDLKTVRSAAPQDFQRALYDYGWLLQAAWYSRAFEVAFERVPSFLFIACSKTPPYQVAVYEVQPQDVRIANRACQRLLEQWRDATTAGVYPGIPQRIHNLQLPAREIDRLQNVIYPE